MSQSDDAFKAQKRAQAHQLSTPHMRALRKELLIARADVERMEIAQASADLRHSVTHFSFLKFLIPRRAAGGFGRNRAAGGGGGIASLLSGLLSGGGVSSLLRQYPIIGSLASLVLTKPVLSKLARGAKPALKWGGLGLLVWEGFRVWQQMKTTSTETSTDAVDPTVF
ncbi:MULTISPECIES: DUF3318 domain-containing protein [unclassified Caballeronia]|uniref:DUF3318 domain-containing protein n=1 Tax=unclassified Caballeronia TaxID=2646786 RepID=UPI00285A6708|nr:MULTISPECIES: DUF3318 domain-containing protein [unclassified Caballeronia]MDR5749680.1 DUF3318 domain-containing protein [Caballeronia sp. LZ024]MDR5843191.1 DUF3318 domain-containing protein [Caballeronia sp. LZ031]